MEKVSIIVPVYNAENSIEVCVESILNQSYSNVECLLIVNGSTDDSASICEKYAREDKRVVTKSVAEAGVSRARNIGLSFATGDIIGFCDADDFLEPNAIQQVVSEFQKDQTVLGVFCSYYSVERNGVDIKKTRRGLPNQIVSSEKAIALTISNDNVLGSVCNKYYRLDALKNEKFEERLSYCEDTHFNVKVLCGLAEDSKIKIIDTPAYCYIMNSGSATHNTRRFFDESGNLRYNVAIKLILQQCKLSRKNTAIAQAKIVRFSIGCAWWLRSQISNAEMRLLLEDAKVYFCQFLLNMNKHDLLNEIKLVAKSLILFSRYRTLK